MKRLLLFLPVLLACAGCSPSSDDASDPVLARVDGQPITLSDVDAEIAAVPRLARPEFSGPIGRSRMLRKMVEEEVLYRAAVEEGIDRDAELRRRIEEQRRQTIVQEYLDRMNRRAMEISDEEARAFYAEHRGEYTTEKMVKVRMMVTSRPELAELTERVAKDNPARFPDACARNSDHPLVIAARGLVPTWIRKDRAVPWIGNHPRFHEVVFALEKDGVSDAFETAAGWVVARVEDVREARQRPFEEVEKDVRGRIARERSTRGLPELLEQLHEKYDVVILEEPAAKSADELFAEAQAAPSAARRVELYRELVERFPDFDRVSDARFMIGFIFAEELGQPDSAAAWFQRVIDTDPDSELAESAAWMLSSGDEAPAFQDDDGMPSDATEVSP